MPASDEQVRDSLMILFKDAQARGMQEVCMAYGWSAIRLGNLILERQYLKTHQRKAS